MSRSTPTKWVTRPSRFFSATTVLEAGNVLPSLRRCTSVPRQMPFWRTSVADVIHHPLEAALEQVRKHLRRQLVARVAQRVDAGVIGVLERAVRARDQDQIGGLLGGGGEQPQARVGALELAALHRQPQRQDAEPGDHRQDGEQQPDGVAGIAERLHAQQPEADQRESGTPAPPKTRPRRHPPRAGTGSASPEDAGRFGGGPQVADERDDPGEVVDAALVVGAAADRAAGDQAQEEPDAGAARRGG